jgi:hypothetical protein
MVLGKLLKLIQSVVVKYELGKVRAQQLAFDSQKVEVYWILRVSDMQTICTQRVLLAQILDSLCSSCSTKSFVDSTI